LSNNDVLLILSNHQKEWEIITEKLLFSTSKLKAGDIVQDMYIKVFDDLTKDKIKPDEIIINNKPHFGIIKNILTRIIQVKSKNIKHHLSIEELNLQIEDNKEPVQVNNIDAQIDAVLNQMYWFDRKLFNLYRKEFHSIRSLSKATKISHVTVYKTIAKCKKLIARKVKL
jgi:predicted glycosyltransferase